MDRALFDAMSAVGSSDAGVGPRLIERTLARRLQELVLANEDWLMRRVLAYAKEHDYTRYASTLIEAWRVSIVGLSAPIVQALTDIDAAPELPCDMDFSRHPASAFGVSEARLHRERGITLGLFLGLFKYYRQAYDDLLERADFTAQERRSAAYFLMRSFDHVELGFCAEWASRSEADKVAELQSRNRSLTNEKNRYLTIFESVRDPVLVLDQRGHIRNMNAAAFETFVPGQAPGAMYYGTASAYMLQQELAQSLPADTDHVPPECVLPTPHGDRTFAISARAMLDISEKFLGRVLILRDVTRERDVQLTLQRANSELRRTRDEADRANAAKGLFLATMSHEIRTPLNAIVGMSQLCSHTELTAPQRSYVTGIGRAAALLMSVVNDVLDFSKIEAGKLEFEQTPFCIADVLDHVSMLTGSTAQDKGLSFVVDCPPDVPPRVVGDPIRLGQVVLNLVSNAIKFTINGSVAVSVRATRHDAGAVELTVEVRDTGCGMDAATAERVFQPFTQAHASISRTHGGTGLGLSISTRLVGLMGGQLRVDTAPGKGSAFWFAIVLPVSEPSDRTRFPSSRAGPGTDGRSILGPAAGASVLVVDDSEINRQVVRAMLTRAGLRVADREGGQQALDLLAIERFDAVLMDVHMPGMDGLAATRAIRAMSALATLPVLALTADAGLEDRQRCVAAGMNEVVVKPVAMADLYAALARWLPHTAVDRPQGRPANRRESRPASGGVGPDAAVAVHRLQDTVEVEVALNRVGGDAAFLLEVLRRFIDSHRDAAVTIRDAIARADLDAGRSLTHAVKGAAGMLAAQGVYEASAALNSALVKRANRSTLDPLVDRFEAEITALCVDVDAIKAAPAGRAELPDPDLARARAAVADLQSKFAVAAYVGVEDLAALRKHATSACDAGLLGELERAVSALDVVQGRALLERIAASLEVAE